MTATFERTLDFLDKAVAELDSNMRVMSWTAQDYAAALTEAAAKGDFELMFTLQREINDHYTW